MAIGHEPLTMLKQLDKLFMMKKGSIGRPEIYLVCKLKKMTLPNGVVAWGMSPSKYIQEAVQNCEKHLDKRFEGRKMAKKATNPFTAGYEPELDVSEPLEPEDATYYQSQIGVLRWMVKLGQVGTITEVSLLALQMA